MKKGKAAVIGASGRMGREIQKTLATSSRWDAFAGVVRDGKAEGFKHSVRKLSDAKMHEADVWIDFSSVENFDDVLKEAIAAGKPLVSGTTGISAAQKQSLTKAGKKIPILWSANMSLGVAALHRTLKIASDLEGFDFQIEEAHHRRKKDAPSGTALALQETLEKAAGKKIPAPISIRGGEIFGIHKVWMMSDEEVLTFEHQALNRAVFAKGAVKAAAWLVGRKPGLYSMADLFADLK